MWGQRPEKNSTKKGLTLRQTRFLLAERVGFEAVYHKGTKMLTDNKTRQVAFRLTASDFDYLYNTAQKLGMTVSEYVRLLVQSAITTAKKGVTNTAKKDMPT